MPAPARSRPLSSNDLERDAERMLAAWAPGIAAGATVALLDG